MRFYLEEYVQTLVLLTMIITSSAIVTEIVAPLIRAEPSGVFLLVFVVQLLLYLHSLNE